MSEPFDYSGLEDTARNLLGSFGRTMQIRVKGGTPVDPLKPWLGTTGDADYTVRGVFDDDTLRRQNGAESTEGRQALVWIFPESPEGTPVPQQLPQPFNPKLADSIIDDDGNEYKTTPDIQTIRPGPVVIMYGFTVEV